MAIEIRSFNQILGDMIRTILAETPLNDLNAGSVLLTLLEAAAANDFENNTAILNVLELLNIDAVQNNDLDARAGDYGLTRNAAIKASGQVTIFNTNITKRATGLYVIKPAPISGQNVLFVNNTDGWAPSGNLYIGRGTQSFEGPIAYSSITQFPTYSQINLSSALQRDHLISDIVIDSQGEPDRVIAAGTIVTIPANSQNPEVQYITLRDAIIPSGEDNVAGVQVIALVAGSQGNAGINTITAFDTPPFSGAAVSNTSAFSNGTDIETDVELRNRIKSYAITLARGTAASIIDAVIGVSDPDDNKQVASAVITEPVSVGEPSILYIDDGSGFEPSYAGQSVDIMLTNATGKEEFLQLANYPVPRPQVVNTEVGPFTVTDGAILRVIVDGQEEDIEFTSSDFLNASAATISEIVIVINQQSTLFKARFTAVGTLILIYPIDPFAEIIQVAPQRATDSDALYINNLLKFPTNEFSYISLFQNATRLHQKAKNAHLETTPFASWNITGPGDAIISVDNTPAQDRSFALSDFTGASSFASLSLDQWVLAFNEKFAGLTATATPSQTMLITSNQTGASSAINVIGGTYLEKWFVDGILTSVGQTSQFELNRQTGNLRVFNIEAGDTISAGVEDAKGFAISSVTSSGNYNVSNDIDGRPSEMVVVPDSTFCDQRSLTLVIGSTISITNPSSSVMRITSATLAAFQGLLPGDFIYFVQRTAGWLNPANTGLYKIFAKGNHLTAGVDSFVDVENVGVVPQANVSILDSLDIKAFTTDGFPQIWRGSYVSNPPVAPITDIVNSLNTDLLNVKASIYKSDSIKITSTTEENGSIAIPVAVSNASLLFTETAHAQLGNPPLIAHRVPSKDLVSSFRRTDAVEVFLNRHTYVDVKRSLLADSVPDQPPYTGTYSEVVDANLDATTMEFDDYLSFTRGDNRGQFRTVKAFPSPGEVGTQESTARTQLDHITGDELQVVRPIQLSTDDSIVVVMDQDSTIKTVDIIMSRTGRVNSGSGGGTFIPTTTEFSANDADNEPSIDFSNTTVWGTTVNNTDFSDYAVWFRARNWYFAGGVGSGNAQFIVRSQQYGPNSEKLRFAFAYPGKINQQPTTSFINTPSFSTYTYIFGSGPARPTALFAGYTIAVAGPYPNTSTNFPSGSPSTGDYFDYTFSAGNFASVQVGDVMTIAPTSGVSANNSGTFRIAAVSGNTFRVFNATGAVASELITNPDGIAIFPLAGNDAATIEGVVNAGTMIELTPVGSTSLTVTHSTAEEDYTYAGNATALAYGHNPTDPTTRDSISLYDGVGYCKAFENPNPNFTLKAPLVLNGVSSAYSMDTAPNADTADIGEYFKLIPTSVKNVYHHMTQKALSQLPIIAHIDISNDRKRVQIDSQLLGSAGAIEVVGGNANKSQAYIETEAEDTTDATGDYLLVKIPAFPDTFNDGDFVTIKNDAGVRRLSRLEAGDQIDVTLPSAGFMEYNYDAKIINVGPTTQFAIADVSASYSLSAGVIWRWTHTITGGTTLAQVNPGDIVFAFGSTSWSAGNMVGASGDGQISGFPIIAVNDGSNYFDVVNPFGVAMSATAVGSGTVQICPTPAIRWTLGHAARIPALSLIGNGTVVTVITGAPHRLNTGDSIDIIDSNNIPDGSESPVTVVNPTTFTFAFISSAFNESSSGASIIKSGLVPTRYRMEKLGFNNLMRLSHFDGASPRFTDCGVAVDDYIILGGSTFKANNNGSFRVVGVDNDSVLLINDTGSDELNTIKNFNNKGFQADWIANTTFLTGVAGTFKDLVVGDWVKKPEDPDSLYLQIVSFSPSTPANATQINLGGNYGGATATAPGIAYDELNSYDKGIYLQQASDITVFEGDAVNAGDTLSVQNIIDTNWFSVNNIGTFDVAAFGTNGSTYKPYIRVVNPSGTVETNRQISVAPAGFYLTESLISKFTSIRQVSHAVLDDLSPDRRSIYMTPDNRSYKFSNANNTSITHAGKLGYSTDVTTGIDGYLYYTGLLRRVQRIVDGYEPDAANYPGRRAVGGAIETLPPLVRRISISINVTTNNGVNLGDITNNIKSVIINYVQGLGVGEDVILSEIIAQVMNIKGVAAVTFTNPVPSTERITLASNERANIVPQDIGIA